MGGAEDFFRKLGGGIEDFSGRATNQLFSIANIPVQMSNAFSNIGNGLANMINNPLFALAVPAIALGGIFLLRK